jgi:pimeloyl-ACP methyl ester carboxylesterase
MSDASTGRAGRSTTVDLDGPVHYVDYGGDGPPLLLIHGLGGSHLNWMLVALPLTAAFRVVTIDLPGFGLSPPAHRSVHVAHQAALVARFVAERFDGPAFVAGNSMGGLITLLTAHRAPHAVRGIVLVNAALPPAVARIPSANTIRFLGPPLLPGIASRLVTRARDSRSVEDHVAATLDFVTADAGRLPAEVREAAHAMETERRAMPWSIPVFIDAQRSIAATLLARRQFMRTIHGIGAPVLIIHGDQDELVPVEAAHWLADTRPDWELEVLAGTGHVPQLEAPADFIRLITRWASAVDSRRPAV